MSNIVTIRGLKLRIFQRKALDVIQLAEYVRRAEDSQEVPNQIFQFAMILRDSLKLNLNFVPWWNIFTRVRIKRAVTLKSIAGSFSLQELAELSKLVLFAEGLTEQDFDELKKKAEQMTDAT